MYQEKTTHGALSGVQPVVYDTPRCRLVQGVDRYKVTVWQTNEPGRVQDAVHVGQCGDDELHVSRQILGQPSINRLRSCGMYVSRGYENDLM